MVLSGHGRIKTGKSEGDRRCRVWVCSKNPFAELNCWVTSHIFLPANSQFLLVKSLFWLPKLRHHAADPAARSGSGKIAPGADFTLKADTPNLHEALETQLILEMMWLVLQCFARLETRPCDCGIQT